MKTTLLAMASVFSATLAGAADLTVGSKTFTEGYLLAELAAQAIEGSTGATVSRRFGLGGTGIVDQAMQAGEIQIYPEYTGTIVEAILKNPKLRSIDEIRGALKDRGLLMTAPLGFNNTYAIGVRRSFAAEHGLRTISDLRRAAPEVRGAFSPEFMTRSDGFPALKERYRLEFPGPRIKTLEHSLAYEAVGAGKADITDVYSTDAKIEKFDLVVLEDDLGFFPRYDAVYLMREDAARAHPEAWEALVALEGSIDAGTMIRLNAEADIRKKTFPRIIGEHLGNGHQSQGEGGVLMGRVLRRTREHLFLVGLALLFSVAVGVPLGIMALRHARLGQAILLLSGAVQTIPSLALLCFLIPLFGIGTKPAIVALCLYGLLPVVLNTFVGLRSIEPRYREMARALGLSAMDQLLRIELPLASASIIAGVRNSAIVSIGTATLAALIGAGGYGVPIVTGLTLNDMGTILIGAVPAAVLALATHFLFDAIELVAVPRGLRAARAAASAMPGRGTRNER